jgi:hypothetical protein
MDAEGEVKIDGMKGSATNDETNRYAVGGCYTSKPINSGGRTLPLIVFVKERLQQSLEGTVVIVE